MPKPFLLPPLPTLYLLSLLFLQSLFTICNGVSVLGMDSLKSTDLDAIMRNGCSKKMGDCFEEPQMESEISRRLLVIQQQKYISYATLRRDMTPCTKPGASYYDCNSREARPYSRGCEVITRCARDIKDINT